MSEFVDGARREMQARLHDLRVEVQRVEAAASALDGLVRALELKLPGAGLRADTGQSSNFPGSRPT